MAVIGSELDDTEEHAPCLSSEVCIIRNAMQAGCFEDVCCYIIRMQELLELCFPACRIGRPRKHVYMFDVVIVHVIDMIAKHGKNRAAHVNMTGQQRKLTEHSPILLHCPLWKANQPSSSGRGVGGRRKSSHCAFRVHHELVQPGWEIAARLGFNPTGPISREARLDTRQKKTRLRDRVTKLFKDGAVQTQESFRRPDRRGRGRDQGEEEVAT